MSGSMVDLPELLGVHLAEALVALDVQALLPFRHGCAAASSSRLFTRLLAAVHRRRAGGRVEVAELLVGRSRGPCIRARPRSRGRGAPRARGRSRRAGGRSRRRRAPRPSRARRPRPPRAGGRISSMQAGLVRKASASLTSPCSRSSSQRARRAPPLDHVESLPIARAASSRRRAAAPSISRPCRSRTLRSSTAALHEEGVQGALVLAGTLALAVLGLVERRLGDVEVAALDQLLHLPVEEGQQQRADVASRRRRRRS